MALAPGFRIGPYELTALLGKGGMGEVYRARDTKLDRDVAIKVLPESLAGDPDRIARFQREAKTLAALNHPHIAAIYGLEDADRVKALVMELVEGPTLADRIVQGAIPIDEALPIAKQIAEALEAAHEQGIIHRDLKPANIKVRPDGTVKVLDFGLAKAMEPVGAGSPNMSQSPTITTPAMTQAGVILGTAAYMSPEQARGKAVDKRADIWAFGCVLYEMLTGRRAFDADDVSVTMARVLEREADLDALPPSVPARVRQVLRVCLRKDPKQRVGDIRDVRLAMEGAFETAVPQAAAPVVAPPHGRWRPVLALTAGSLVIAAVAVWFPRPVPPRPVTRFALSLPPAQRLATPEEPAVALSPDGTRVAYVAIQGGTAQLYLRAMDSSEARPIPGTEGAAAPFFSPDSQWLGFFTQGKLKKVSVSGGPAVSLCDVPGPLPRSASWGPDDTIAFSWSGSNGLWRVSAAGGTAQRLTTLDSKKAEGVHAHPDFLPGGEALFFVAANGFGAVAGTGQIVVRSQQTGERRDVIAGTHPSYVPSGHLIYVREGTLMAVPFDPRRLAATGSPAPVIENVLQSPASGFAQYDVSSTGSLVYIAGGLAQAPRRLVWVDRKGVEQPLPAPPRLYRSPRLAPDGRRVAVGTAEGTIWIYDLARETLTRLTFGGSSNTPVWTPDGKRIAFQGTGMSWQPADGSGGAERLTDSNYQHVDGSWSPDGQLLAFVEVNPETSRDIWVLRLSDRKPQPFLRMPFTETAPQFSPDGRWLAYGSDESGRSEIYVQPYPGPGGKFQISTEGGTEPVWARNGEILYRSADKMMAVDTTTQPAFSAGNPKMLFEGRYVPTLQTMPNYDVSPDGRRFLMVKEGETTSSAQINVVLNWFEELKRRVPAK